MYTTNNWILDPLTKNLVNSLLDGNDFHENRKNQIQQINGVKKDGLIVLKYKVPGYDRDDIKIDIKSSNSLNSDRILTVIANNTEYGGITYKSYVPKNIEEKQTKANLKNGILTLTLVEEKIKSPFANLKIEVD